MEAVVGASVQATLLHGSSGGSFCSGYRRIPNGRLSHGMKIKNYIILQILFQFIKITKAADGTSEQYRCFSARAPPTVIHFKPNVISAVKN
jgi:hypothetical protein